MEAFLFKVKYFCLLEIVSYSRLQLFFIYKDITI